MHKRINRQTLSQEARRTSAAGNRGQSQRLQVKEVLANKGFQAKLKIGAPNDRFEQEADDVADQVMRMPASENATSSGTAGQSATPDIQRMCTECEEEERLQTKATPGTTPQVNSGAEAMINSVQGGGQPLRDHSRAFFEPRFDRDFGQVRLHHNHRSAQLAQTVGARAFTVGRDIVFGSGQYAPETSAGKKLLAHELTHVVQQDSDRHEVPSLQRAPDAPVNVDLPLTDREYADIQRWKARGEVGITPLTGVRAHDLDVISRSIFCSRLLAAGGLGRGDPLLCVLETVTRADPRFPAVRAHVARAVPVGCATLQTASIELVKLNGSNRDPAADLRTVNEAYAECCVRFVLRGSVHNATAAQTTAWLGGDNDIQRVHSCSNAHAEERNMLNNATRAFGLNARYIAFYAESATPGVRGVSFPTTCASGNRAPFARRLYVLNTAANRTLGHELGHITMGSLGSHSTHGGGTDNIMQTTNSSPTGVDITVNQCRQVRANL